MHRQCTAVISGVLPPSRCHTIPTGGCRSPDRHENDGSIWVIRLLMLYMPPTVQVVQAVQAAEAAHGPVDVLICCAGAAELGERR